MAKISWIQNGSSYKRVEGEVANVKNPPVGIYNINLGMTGWSLERYADKFTFDYKIYGLETDFMDHVMKCYNNTTGNFGVLLTGTKGTGKSVTAKLIANRLDLPIIIVKSFGDSNQDLIEFLSSFNFDCVLFFDEFEKNFNEEDSSILQLMDGVYTSDYRRIFLLTTNETTINSNMLSRPSRLRYVKRFSNLPQSVVDEILEDKLQDKSAKQKAMEYVDTLSISTIDILKSIIEEINIFGIDEFLHTKHYFNVTNNSYFYKVRAMLMDTSEISKYAYDVPTFLQDIKEFAAFVERSINMSGDECADYRYSHKKFGDYRHSLILELDSKWDNYKKGDIINNDERIIYIDKKNLVIITNDSFTCNFYKILNPNQKPSLYSEDVELIF